MFFYFVAFQLMSFYSIVVYACAKKKLYDQCFSHCVMADYVRFNMSHFFLNAMCQILQRLYCITHFFYSCSESVEKILFQTVCFKCTKRNLHDITNIPFSF